ncbi:CDC25 [Symbiodinium sp. CCMP2592]|nr:CDC25 [Symbiodinium sp. CCMP2592]
MSACSPKRRAKAKIYHYAHYAPAAPRAAPVVVAMPWRQIYVPPLVVPTPAACPAHQSFRTKFQHLAASPPLPQPVVAPTRSLAPSAAKMERIHGFTVQTTTKTVVAAPRPFAPGLQTKEQTSTVQTTTKTVGPTHRLSAEAAALGLLPFNFEVLSPAEVHQLLKAGQCALIDVRRGDRASGHIQGAVHKPDASNFNFKNGGADELVAKLAKEKLVIFHCEESYFWGPQCATYYRLKAPSTQRVAVLEGGFRGWERNRLPVVYEQPMDAAGQAKADIYDLSIFKRLAGAGA